MVQPPNTFDIPIRLHSSSNNYTSQSNNNNRISNALIYIDRNPLVTYVVRDRLKSYSCLIQISQYAV